MIPNTSLPKRSWFFTIGYPRPTQQTLLTGKRITYRVGNMLKTEQDVINILEELTRAAEIVESGAPYYAP